MTRNRTNSEPDDKPEEKKERVIHTRVPESLETELRQKAQDLGISVSNLVRNVLGHAFGLVGDVVADSHAIARAARGAAAERARAEPTVRAPLDDASDAALAPAASTASPRAPAPAASPTWTAAPSIDDMLGWQPMVLGKNAVCARCNAILPRGSDAASGVTEGAASRLVICLACLEVLRA